MPLPPFAPIGPSGLICLRCGELMRLEVEKYANGNVSRILFYCDKCEYGHEPSMNHASGTFTKYVPPTLAHVPPKQRFEE